MCGTLAFTLLSTTFHASTYKGRDLRRAVLLLPVRGVWERQPKRFG